MTTFWEGDADAVPVEDMRRLAREHCKEASVRTVAAAVGVGRTTLHKFVAAGAMPHPRVRNLLQRWYRRNQSGAADAVAALTVLLRGVPPHIEREAAGWILDAVERAHRTAEQEPPGWIASARGLSFGGDAGAECESSPARPE